MNAERVENSTQSVGVILVEVQKDSEVWYQPVEVNRKARDDVSAFIIEEKTRFKSRLKDLRTIPRRNSRNKEVARRVISVIRASREKVIQSEGLEEKIMVLEGKEVKPIRLQMEGGFIRGFEIVDFANKEQEEWWRFVKDEGLLNSLAQVAKSYPQGPGLLQEAYSIRRVMTWGSSGEGNKAKQKYENFKIKSREIPEEYDKLMVPFFRVITNCFAVLDRP
ncbi:MAG: hypothetical protein ABIJ85_00765 [bacterium]